MVSVTQFIFHVLQLLLLLIRCTQPNLRCISKSTTKHLQQKLVSLDEVMVIGSACRLSIA
jgi:hypothetical protein